MASTNITTFPGIIKIAGELVGDGAGVSNVQTSNVIGLSDNVARIGTLETDLSDNSSRITSVESGAHVFSGIKTFEDDIILESNLRVQGDLLVANTVNMTVSDPIIELGSNNLNTGDIGLVMTRHGASESNVTMFYDETEDRLKIGYTLNGANDTVLALDSNALPVDIQGELTVGGDVTMTDTASGSAAGPEFSLYRNQTGSNGNYLGQIRFDGKHDGGNDQLFGKITGKIKRATSGNEDGIIETALVTDGSQRISVRHSGDLFHIKNGTDFQVGETANLYVDTATSRVGVNTSSPAYPLDVHGSANVGALTATLTYSNAASNIVTWNSSTNEVIDSGLEKGFTEHPVAAMTDYHTYVEGHGTYEASASSEYVSGSDQRLAWKALNLQSGDYTNSWRGVGVYDTSSPYAYDTAAAYNISNPKFITDVGGTRYNGDYIILKVPRSILLSHTVIYETTSESTRAPTGGIVLGSSDGQNWFKLTEFSSISYTNGQSTVNVNATTPYTHFALVVTNIGGSTVTSLSEWRLFAEKDVTKMENVHISGDLSSETLQTGYIKWPRVPLKANESEGYVASASNVYNTSVTAAPFTAFNQHRETGNNGYSDAFVGGNGDFTAGVANKSRTTGDDTFNHEWLQIQLPRAIQLSHFTLLQRLKNLDNDTDMPKNGRMYGSNDGVSWTKLVTFSDLTYERFEETRVDVKSSAAYKYYRLAITDTIGSSQVYVAIGELQLFEAATGVGAPPTSAKLQVHGSLGLAKGSSLYAGDSVVAEFPKHDRPLTKYPEVAMTAASSGGYTASASSYYSSAGPYEPWEAFDNITGGSSYWSTSSGTYTTQNGTTLNYTGTTYSTNVEGTDKFGEWLQIELPRGIRYKYSTILAPSDHEERVPRDGYIVGRNDTSGPWTILHRFEDVTRSTTTETVTYLPSSKSTQTFKYLRLVIESITYGGANFAGVDQWNIFGTEEGDESVDVVHRSVPNKPGTQQLEVYWDANDSNSYSFADSDAVYDLSGNGVTGTLANGVGFDSEYNAFTFDGSNDYISGSLATTTGAWAHSFSFWMNADTAGVGHLVALGAESTNNASVIRFDGTDLFRWYFWSNDLRFNAPNTFQRWVHVVGTYDGGNDSGVSAGNYGVSRKIFINGKETTVNENMYGTAGTNPLNLTTTTTPFRVGSQLSGTAYFDGKIANVRVFSKKLSIHQIRELYEYDAERFGHRTNVVSLHKGNLGIGVNYPNSRFEVAGREDLQEYPPRGMTGNETHVEGHGVFRASASTESTNQLAWEAFNKSTDAPSGYGDRWRSFSSRYVNTSGGSPVNTTNVGIFNH